MIFRGIITESGAEPQRSNKVSEVKVRRNPNAPKKIGLDLAVTVAQLRMSLERIAEGRTAQDWRYRRQKTDDAIALIEDAIKSIEQELNEEVENA
jgi:hypothetical protein